MTKIICNYKYTGTEELGVVKKFCCFRNEEGICGRAVITIETEESAFPVCNDECEGVGECQGG